MKGCERLHMLYVKAEQTVSPREPSWHRFPPYGILRDQQRLKFLVKKERHANLIA